MAESLSERLRLLRRRSLWTIETDRKFVRRLSTFRILIEPVLKPFNATPVNLRSQRSMSEVHAVNVKVSTSDSLLSGSSDSICRLVPLRTKGELEANNRTGTITKSQKGVVAEHSLTLVVDVYIVEIPTRSTSTILE